MKKVEQEKFETLCGQLGSFYDEVSVLSKKTPNDALNKFKLKFINQLLGQANAFLGKYKPLADFDVFSIDDVPSNSDVVFVLAQYLEAFERLRGDNVIQYAGTFWWKLEPVKGDPLDDKGRLLVRTTKPKRLQE